jgi:hypothetical protein
LVGDRYHCLAGVSADIVAMATFNKMSPHRVRCGLGKLRRLADAGDLEAMLRLARTYESGTGSFWVGQKITSLPPDQSESLRYYKLAADLGDSEALSHLFGVYSGGRTVPENQAIADQYLNKAVQYGAEWAILLLAHRQETSAPAKALESYLSLARNNNCPAQRRLSHAYQSGVLVKKNLTQAYFWALLASANYWARRAQIGWEVECDPNTYMLDIDKGELKRALPPKLVQVAQDASTSWSKGTSEQLLPAPTILETSETGPGANKPREATTITPSAGPKTSPKAELRPRATAEPTDWVPVRPSIQTVKWTPLSKDVRLSPIRDKQSAEELFAKSSSSVWVVIATTSTSQSDALSNASQGSAVAITPSRLLTNYHVIDGQRFVFIKQGDKIFEATVIAGDKESDRSVLQVKGAPLTPVAGLRGFEELRVGEQVYTIGAPSSLESTLGQGIVSGLRTMARQHLVQTTAPISPGSSGGGLFDNAGNLIGITSFALKNRQGLNFAISADEYFH